MPVDDAHARAAASAWRRFGKGRHPTALDFGGVSRKVLTQTLRRLQEYGLVQRELKGSRLIQYELTGLGRTLIEPIEVLAAWGRDHGDEILDFQDAAAVRAVLAGA